MKPELTESSISGARARFPRFQHTCSTVREFELSIAVRVSCPAIVLHHRSETEVAADESAVFSPLVERSGLPSTPIRVRSVPILERVGDQCNPLIRSAHAHTNRLND